MHAGNRATRCASLLGDKFTLALFVGVLQQRNSGITALLRTVMNQFVLANIQIARAGAATPIVFESLGYVELEFIDARERSFFQGDDLVENFLLARTERLQLAVVVVENSDGGCKSKL